MHQDKDRSSKWLITHHGDAILKLAGYTDFTAWKHRPSEVVAPRRILDGLLEVRFPTVEQPSLVLIEIESYPSADADRQVLEDVALVMLEHNRIPEVVSLVLKQRGQQRVTGRIERASPRGTTAIGGRWPVVELWNLDADALLADGDIGLIPWVPLARSDRPAEEIVQGCVNRIDGVPNATERSALLTVTQILAGLAFPGQFFDKQFGGSKTVIESPVLDRAYEMMRELTRQTTLVELLEVRFPGAVPESLIARIKETFGVDRLRALHQFAVTCPTVEAFAAELDKP